MYALAPEVNCKGLCWSSCTEALPVSRLEHGRLADLGYRLPVPATLAWEAAADDHRAMCPALNPQTRRCEAYEARLLICRTYGGIAGATCKHGCAPEPDANPLHTIAFVLWAEWLGGSFVMPAASKWHPVKLLRSIGPGLRAFLEEWAREGQRRTDTEDARAAGHCLRCQRDDHARCSGGRCTCDHEGA